jgi:hypothetical protein
VEASDTTSLAKWRCGYGAADHNGAWSPHVGLLCTAGLLNGVFGEREDRHIARWRSVKHVATFLLLLFHEMALNQWRNPYFILMQISYRCTKERVSH